MESKTYVPQMVDTVEVGILLGVKWKITLLLTVTQASAVLNVDA